MRGKTKRKIKRYLGIPFAIIGVVFTVGGVISAICAYFLPFPVWVWFIVFVALVLISAGLLYLYSKVSAPKLEYFEQIDFGTPDENTIREAVEGILNTEKVSPFYVHAAPKCKEVETVYLRLKDAGFAMISGRPGEGKSMVAYHAAWRLQSTAGYRVYALKTGELEGKTGGEVLDEILSQLDRLKGKKKLILVDDAHKLALKKDSYAILQQEAKEEHGKYIWIETELYGEEPERIQADTYIRINFQEFLKTLLEGFYRSKNLTLQKALDGRIEGLEDAIDRVHKNKILDVWLFAFCTSRREERLAREIDDLSNPESVVLFFISAYTVLSAEAELHRNDVLNMVSNLKFGWLVDELKKSSVGDVIRSLQNRKLIKIYDRSKSDKGYIASLHYNFARAVLQACLFRESLAEDLLTSVRVLLTDEYRKCIYIGVFHHDIGAYATKFDRENKDWLISFVNNPLPEWLQNYPYLLRAVKVVAKSTYDEIIAELDTNSIAKKINDTKAEKLQQIAYLLDAMGDRQGELIKKLDLAQLSKTADSAEVGQFGQLAHLLDAMGDRQGELIKKLDLAQLSKTADSAKVGQFQQIAYLLDAMGDRRGELIDKLDLAQLSKTARSAEVGQFQQIAYLLDAMGDRRGELIEKLDLAQLSKTADSAEVGQFGQLAPLLDAMGDRQGELIKKLDLAQLSKAARSAEAGKFQQIAYLLDAMGDRRGELIEKLGLAQLSKTADSAEVGQFDQLANLLNAMGDRRGALIEKLDLAQLSKTADSSEVGQFGQLAHLLNAIGDRRGELIEKLDLAQLSKTAGTAKAKQFDQLSNLLDALSEQKDLFVDQLVEDNKIIETLAETVSSAPPDRFQAIAKLLDDFGSRKIHLITLLDYDSLVEKANEVSPDDTRGLILFMARLDEEHRNRLIRKVDWASLCMNCAIRAGLFRALGGCLENLRKQAEMLSDKTGCDKVVRYLRDRVDEIVQEIKNAYEQTKMYGPLQASLYAGVGKFLWHCNQIDHILAFEVTTKTMSKLIECFWIAPINYYYVGQLIDAFYEISPDLSKSFLRNNKARGRVQQSINEHDWAKEVEGLKHLVEAFYRSDPDLWRRMVNSNWIVVDLSSLDLDSIYRDVDEEKDAGTA